MSKMLTFEIDADEAKRLENEIEAIFDEIRRTNERMKAAQVEIDRLKAESHQLAADTQIIANETRQRLAYLWSASNVDTDFRVR